MGTSGRPEVQGPEVRGPDAQGSDAQGSDVQRSVQRARHAASQARRAADARAQRDRLRETLAREMFARPVRDYAHRNAGRPVRVLRAGFGASPEELGLSQLRDRGYEITVATVDQAGPGAPSPAPAGDVRLGDLRAVPIPPRSFDIVHCALLLDRIRHVELVLDRFIAALRPGGYLMLRIRDRDCAIGLLDRRLPRPARRLLQARLGIRLEAGDAPAAGRPGPRPLFPAVYERACSDDGIQEYARMRGLVITQRETARTWPDGPDRLSRTVAATGRLIAWLTRGRLTDAHDEVLYVIRKPEDHFARIV